jgi:hypothetical protein
MTPLIMIAAAVALSGCGSISQKFADTASQMPGVGLPQDAPERPTVQGEYPAVHDIPPPRNTVTLTSFEQQKLEDDLMAARDHQQSAVGLPKQPKTQRQVRQENALKGDQSKSKGKALNGDHSKPMVPVSSSQSIY